MSDAAPFTDAFASASGAQSMRDVLSRRCAEQVVEIAALRKECERLREALAQTVDINRRMVDRATRDVLEHGADRRARLTDG